MASTRDIQRRIKSVNSTMKITKAMEMVAASKMRKAVEGVLRTRTYANLSWETILNLSQASSADGKALHPLLEPKQSIKKICVILITSNRGLCGGFNSAIISKAHRSVQLHQNSPDLKTDFIVIGTKGRIIHRHYGYDIVAEFPKTDIATGIDEILPVAKAAVTDYLSGKYDKVMVAYTDFVTASNQVPRVKQLLPVDIDTQDAYLGVAGKDTRVGLDKDYLKTKLEKHSKSEKYQFDFCFEPSPSAVLDEMVPRLIEVQLFQALLESNASEHSARMAAMHQANDAAKDMVAELTLNYNKARQAAITAEIAEISAGANSLN